MLLRIVSDAFAKYCAPWWLIGLAETSNVVSVCVNHNGEHVTHETRNCLTMLVCNALAKYSAPWTPILLNTRSSVVSIYVEWLWRACDT